MKRRIESSKINKPDGKNVFVFIFFLLLSTVSLAQVPFTTSHEKRETRNGNKHYNNGNYTDAEASYKKALDTKNNMPQAIFNLGNALYKQKRYDEAIKQFQLAAQTNPDTTIKAKAYHNLGNTYLEQQKWEDAAKAYKQSLRFNPKDADTKYNLAYANAMIRQQQNEKQNQQDNKEDKEKKEDKQEQQQDSQQKKEENKNSEQNKQEQENQEKGEQEKPKPQPKLSKEEAEKLLQAIQNEEQKTNQKAQQKQMRGVRIKVEKDW